MLTSAGLQLIALITMLIDHIGAFLMGDDIVMRLIGRIAMPLFCFMLAEGFLHTKSRKKRLRYFERLIIFAFISQFAFDLVHFASAGNQIVDLPRYLGSGAIGYKLSLNVLFTLTTGFAAMALLEYGGYAIICLPILPLIASALNMDYGAFGVLMIIGFYLVSKYLSGESRRVLRWLGYIFVLFSITTAHVAIRDNSRQLFAIVAIFPILFYNGKLGKRLPKWFGYVFYPAHLLAIAVIAFTTNIA